MQTTAFQKKILTWYKNNKRDLPWRTTTDPYKILVSEIMLQQTQVDRVIPKYALFLKTFPTINALAQAPSGKVLELWSGLGYNNRAVRLWEAAKELKEKYNSIVPCNREQLLQLPGIGPYTADAILSFAFNLPYPCMDTNIRRVFLHELKLSESIPKNTLYNIAQSCIPEGKAREWNNALMDYGSQVLTARETGIKPLSKQSTFLHSRRWYRGQIMKLLVQRKRLAVTELQNIFKKEKRWTCELLQEMEQEGLLRRIKNVVLLPD